MPLWYKILQPNSAHGSCFQYPHAPTRQVVPVDAVTKKLSHNLNGALERDFTFGSCPRGSLYKNVHNNCLALLVTCARVELSPYCTKLVAAVESVCATGRNTYNQRNLVELR